MVVAAWMAGGKAASRLQKDLDEVWDYITERDRAVASAESEKRKHLEKRVRVAEEPRHVRVEAEPRTPAIADDTADRDHREKRLRP